MWKVGSPVVIGVVIGVMSGALVAGCEAKDRPASARTAEPGGAAGAAGGTSATTRVAAADAMAPIVAMPGALELVPEDGYQAGCMSAAEYTKAWSKDKAKPWLVLVHDFPPGLSAHACVDGMFSQGKNIGRVIDGDDARGYTLIYDENANGDLRDDPRHVFARTADGFEVVATMMGTDPKTHESFPMRMRFRRRAGKLFEQGMVIRRGELALGERKLGFALISEGDFSFPVAAVAFDLDGDGKAGPAEIELGSLHDLLEVRQVFERTVTIGGRSYDFAVDVLGDHLTLTPRPAAVAERPSLHVGTPAPDFTATDLEGKRVQLSALRGRTVLLDFWATGCGPCVRSLPRLSELSKRWHASDVEVVAIATDSKLEDVQKLFETKPRAGIEVLDRDAPNTLGELSALYRVYEYPSYFVVGPDGNLVRARCTLDDAVGYLESRGSVRVPR
jgi:thiol-disulfide isomerase/thioredoxin